MKEYRPALYSSLLLSEKLYSHLLEIDETANARMDICPIPVSCWGLT